MKVHEVFVNLQEVFMKVREVFVNLQEVFMKVREDFAKFSVHSTVCSKFSSFVPFYIAVLVLTV